MSKCKSCGAEIIWVPTVNGKAMPCDAKPIPYEEDPTGNLTLVTSDALSLPANERAKVRSKTFPGIAKAMAEQWGSLKKPYEKETQIELDITKRSD